MVGWMRKLFGFPESATGLVRNRRLDGEPDRRSCCARYGSWVLTARCAGVAAGSKRAHGVRLRGSAWLHRASAGYRGHRKRRAAAVRRGPTPSHQSGCVGAAIAADRNAGFTPFLLIGTAGTVDTGAIDDLEALADLARSERLWFHVDGACGALAMLAPRPGAAAEGHRARRFAGVRFSQMGTGALRRRIRAGARWRFASANLRDVGRRTCGARRKVWPPGAPWPCDFGPDLSRGFRALKTWFTLKVYGAEAIGQFNRADLRAGALSGKQASPNARAGAARAGRIEHRVLPLSRG